MAAVDETQLVDRKWEKTRAFPNAFDTAWIDEFK